MAASIGLAATDGDDRRGRRTDAVAMTSTSSEQLCAAALPQTASTWAGVSSTLNASMDSRSSETVMPWSCSWLFSQVRLP